MYLSYQYSLRCKFIVIKYFFFSFNDILTEISKIPMLPALLENNSEERARMDSSTNDVKNVVHQSLLEWVTARQGLTNLEHIVEHCENSLKQVFLD